MALKITRLILLLVVFSIIEPIFAGQNEKTPKPSDYPVKVYTGKRAAIKGNDKDAKEHKKQIQGDIEFAGHYIISYFPAGSLKYEDFYILDVITGETINPLGSPAPYDRELDSDYFWPNSRLLIVNRNCHDEPKCQNKTSYYLFEKNKFILLNSIKHEQPLDDSDFESED